MLICKVKVEHHQRLQLFLTRCYIITILSCNCYLMAYFRYGIFPKDWNMS